MPHVVADAARRCTRALAWCVAFGLAVAVPAQAAVCKYIDADGNIVFSNLPPEKGQRKISCIGGDEPGARKAVGATRSATVPSAPAQAAPSPAGFPKVDADTQRGRDDIRRKVLSDELAEEGKLLAEARTAYANGAPVPLPEEQANAERYRERIARLRESVARHERNIEMLKKELGTTR